MPSLPISKVPYTEIVLGSGYRPYLEVFLFFNNKVSSKTFGLMDSGADFTVIPFSLGKDIGLTDPKDDSELKPMSGVGGLQSYVERKCRIYIPDGQTKVIYGFEENVSWVYPSANIRSKQKELIDQYDQFKSLREQSKDNTPLSQYFEEQERATIIELKKVNDICETDVLLGRTFFNNFSFVQFVQRDKVQESKCAYHLQVNRKKIIQQIPFEE